MLETEPWLRVGCFLAVFAVLAAWEARAPRRRPRFGRRVRWPGNLGIVALNSLAVRVLFPTGAVAFGDYVERAGHGLLSGAPIPTWLAVVLAVILLDLAIYLQHVLFHAVPGLWRLHRMHHADLDIDASTGVRFHTVEIVLSFLLKLAVIVAIGAPAIAVLIFEILLNATSMFSHANVRVPLSLEPYLRWIVVTPDMHRVHHSIHRLETNSNFGFNLPWWDRLFGTYRGQPRDGHEGMTIGIEQFRTEGDLRLDRMLTQPLRDDAGRYPFNRDD
jgi:sterol desaturase/sphingolipid hydroxylase (fatty acid hydroxylase superfamily)